MKTKISHYLIVTAFSCLCVSPIWSNNSLLSTGDWYKFKVNESAVYKITYNQVQSLGFTNLQHIKIYGIGGEQLSYWNSDDRPEELQEIPLKFFKGSDGIFNQGDYLLVYLEGPVVWKYYSASEYFKHTIHNYSKSIYYFITSSATPSKEVDIIDNSSIFSEITFQEGDWYSYFEENVFNPINSGRTWYGNSFTDGEFKENFVIDNFKSDIPIYYQVKSICRNRVSEKISLFINENPIGTKTIPFVSVDDKDAVNAREANFSGTLLIDNNQLEVSIKYSGLGSSDRANLDYILLNAKVNLQYSNELEYRFRNKEAEKYSTVQFSISSLTTDALVWDVTEFNKITELVTQETSGGRRFKDNGGAVREYIAFNPSANFPSPIFDNSEHQELGFIENQNLKGKESENMLIVTHKLFLEPAEELAEWHRTEDDLSVLVVTPEQIYNEYSSGNRDISAIRDYIKHLYEKSSSDENRLKYVLLFGDGSYNNHNDIDGNTNYIPTYQSPNSLSPTSSYVSDDFYGLLEEGEGEVSGDLDIGIGRLPVSSDGRDEQQAWAMVNKIKEYYSSDAKSDWRLRIAFFADDALKGWELQFMGDSDSMAKSILQKKPEFQINKIYCDGHNRVTSSTGATYPSAEEAVKKILNQGVLVFNYMGHGNENTMTEEKVIQKEDIENLENAPYYPLIITASCQVGRFDHVEMLGGKITPTVSAGEAAILNTKGGAIAALTTTRLVFQTPNSILNQNVYDNLFLKDSNNCYSRLGDVIRRAKNQTTGANKLSFALLGDPAIKLAIPENIVLIDSINSRDTKTYTDTLSAFSEITISGRVVDSDSALQNSFNGTVSMNVFDKEVEITTKSNHGLQALTYYDQNNKIYKGKASVKNGLFTTKFRVPKDISYNFGYGKISLYAEDGLSDASGYNNNIIIGGTSDEDFYDVTGPQISLYLNNPEFEDGFMAGPDPTIYAEVFDESGINTTGLGIGHDIVAYLENDEDNILILNDYYQADLDDYRKGTVIYKLRGLSEGEHKLYLKVWDINNNSSEVSLNFNVVNNESLVLTDLINMPNPVNSVTNIQYKHNVPYEIHNVTLSLYDVSGRLLLTKKRAQLESGYVSEPFVLDIEQLNIRQGIYPYSIKVETNSGKKSIINQKLIIIR